MADYEVYFAETTLDCDVPVPDTIYVYDEQVNNSWWKWSGMSATSLVALDPVVDGERLIMGEGSSGLLSELEQTGKPTDDGTTITSRWTTKWHDAGSPDLVKIWRSIYLNIDVIGTPVLVSWETDSGKSTGSFYAQFRSKYYYYGPPAYYVWNNTGGTQNNGLYWGGEVKESLQYSLPQAAVGRRIQFTFDLSAGSTATRVLGYQLYYRVRRQRYFPETNR